MHFAGLQQRTEADTGRGSAATGTEMEQCPGACAEPRPLRSLQCVVLMSRNSVPTQALLEKQPCFVNGLRDVGTVCAQATSDVRLKVPHFWRSKEVRLLGPTWLLSYLKEAALQELGHGMPCMYILYRNMSCRTPHGARGPQLSTGGPVSTDPKGEFFHCHSAMFK